MSHNYNRRSSDARDKDTLVILELKLPKQGISKEEFLELLNKHAGMFGSCRVYNSPNGLVLEGK